MTTATIILAPKILLWHCPATKVRSRHAPSFTLIVTVLYCAWLRFKNFPSKGCIRRRQDRACFYCANDPSPPLSIPNCWQFEFKRVRRTMKKCMECDYLSISITKCILRERLDRWICNGEGWYLLLLDILQVLTQKDGNIRCCAVRTMA